MKIASISWKVYRAGLLLMVLLSLTSAAAAAEVDLIALSRSLPGDALLEEDCYRLKSVLTPYERGGFLLKLPAVEGKALDRIVLPSVTVKPSTRYLIDWEIMPQQFLQLYIFARFANPRNGLDPLTHVLTFENSSAFMRLGKEIITPPDATALKLYIYVFSKTLKPDALLGYFKSLTLRECGPAQPDPSLKEHAGKNIITTTNFEAFDIGEKNPGKLGLFPAAPTSKHFGAVVSADEKGRKVLRCTYKPGDYQYFSWYSPGEMNLYGATGIMRCRMRGKGKVQLMVYWGRTGFHTIFKHFGFFELTPEWQEYSVGIGCDDPLTRSVAATIACRDKEADFEISDISFTLGD